MQRFHSLFSSTVVAFAIGSLGGLSAQTLNVSPNPLNLSAPANATQVQGTLAFASSTSTPLTFSLSSLASWLQVPQQQFGTPASITVTANLSNLQPGINQGSLVASYNGTSVTVGVNVSVSSIGVSATSVSLGSYQSGSANFPPPQSIAVSGATGAVQLDRSTSDGALWFTAAPIGTPAPTGVLVSVDQNVANNLQPGSYSGTLTITPTAGGNNVPVKVAVSFTVTAAPQVTVSPASLAFNWQASGTNNLSQQTIQLSSTGSVSPAYQLSVSGDLGGSWILAPNPLSGAIPANGSQQVTVSVNGAGLQPGTYNGKVTVGIQNGFFAGGQTSQDVAIRLIVSNFPLINVSTTPLNYTYQFGSGTPPPAQSVTPASTGAPGTQVTYTVAASTADNGSWLRVPAGIQTTGNPLSVSIDTTTLVPQTYSGTVTITPIANGSGQAAIQIPVSLKVTNNAILVVSPTALVFPYQLGQAVPIPQNVSVTSSTGAPLNYAVAAPSNVSWLQLNGPTSGTTDQTFFTIGVNTAGAAAGAYDAPLTITATDPATGAVVGNPVTVDVKFYVSATPLLVVTPPGPVSLSAVLGGQSASAAIALTSTSPAAGDQLTTTVVEPTASWFSSTATPTVTGRSFTISAIPNGGQTPGVYTGSITVSATGSGGGAVADSPWTTPVTFQLNAANASVTPTSLTFSQAKGGQPPTPQSVTVQSGASLAFTAVANDGGVNWLSVSSASGFTNGTFTVSADSSKLTTGTYNGAVYVTVLNGGGSPFRIPVTFNVTAGAISVLPTTINAFTQAQGAPAPAAQSVTVTGSPNPISFTVSTNPSGSWLSATPSGLATPATVQISVDATKANLTPGPYSGTVTINAPGASPSAIQIPVSLTVVASQPLTATPTQLSFAYTVGAGAPPAQTVQVAAAGGPVPYTVAVSSSATWLQVTPLKGNTPDNLIVNITNLATLTTAGNLIGTITVSSSNSATSASITVNLAVGTIPKPVIQSVTNAGSYAASAVAPGEGVTIFGTGVGPATAASFGLTDGGAMDTIAGNTRVLFDGIPAPVYYASATQTSVFVPYEVAGRPTTTVRLEYLGVLSDPIIYTVVPAQPGIYTLNFSGTGPGAIRNNDATASVNSPTAPAPKGSYVSVYMTGEGELSPQGVNGAFTPNNGTGLKFPKLPVSATVGGIPTTAVAASAPGGVNGFTQVNVLIPPNAPSGPAVSIVITFGPAATGATFNTQQGVTLAVQ